MELKNNISKIKESIENTITFEKAEKTKVKTVSNTCTPNSAGRNVNCFEKNKIAHKFPH